MPAFARAELEEMVSHWLAENQRCEQLGDWRPLAEPGTDDATYGANMGPELEFTAAGRDEMVGHP